MKTRLPHLGLTQNGLRFILIIIIALSAFAISHQLAAYVYNSTGSTSQSLQVDPDYRRGTEELFQKVRQDLKETRGLSPSEKTELRFVSMAWYSNAWGKNYVESISKEILTEEKILKALLLIQPQTSLKEFRTQWTGAAMAATSGSSILILQEHFDPNDPVGAYKILAHESVHVIQNENFPLFTAKTRDEKMALLAFTEGDADYTARIVMTRMGYDSTPVSPQSDAGSKVRQPLLALEYFPYRYGEAFIQYLFNEGGWPAVDQAYMQPPRSTMQILHPDRYSAEIKEMQMGATPPLTENWLLMKKDRMGEYFLQIMLNLYIPHEEATTAADGWQNDILAYYESEGRFFLVWTIKWNNMEEAKQFTEAFHKYMNEADATMKTAESWSIRGETIQLNREDETTILIYSGQ